MARDELGAPRKIWEEILKKAQAELHPERTSFTFQMILMRLAGGDEERALEMLREAVERLLPEEWRTASEWRTPTEDSSRK